VATVIGTGVVGFPAGSTQATLREPHGGIAIAFGPDDRLYLLLGGLTVINDASLRSSQVSVLPTTYSPHVGQPMGIYGALTFTNQSPTGARTLDVSADGPDGAHADLGQITTAADGTYTGEVSIPSPGGWTITVTYPGDGTHRPSHASTEQIQFSLTKANLQVALSSHVITYGHTITLTITLDAWHTNTVVELSRVSPGSTRVDMGPIDLGSDGTATLTLKPGRNTTYRAVWAGDDWYYPLTSNQPGVNVYAVVEDSLSGGYATQGGVRLYHYQTACPSSHRYCPIMNGTVIPNHAGKSIVFLIQMHTSSGWKNAGSGTLKIPSSGTAKAILIYKTRAVISVLQRFRAVFPGDADHLKAYGPWRAFKITN
jgi:hypothetical protein